MHCLARYVMCLCACTAFYSAPGTSNPLTILLVHGLNLLGHPHFRLISGVPQFFKFLEKNPIATTHFFAIWRPGFSSLNSASTVQQNGVTALNTFGIFNWIKRSKFHPEIKLKM